MFSLQIYLFGAPRVERQGETVSIRRRKAMALLAYLAVTGQPHSRDALATMFWPENDQSSALANLRRDLSRLKRAVGDQALAVDRSQIGLDPEAEVWLDVAVFRDEVERVREHGCAASELCDDCLDLLTEAVALYTDDFMAGFNLSDSLEFDEWQFFQAEGLRQSLGEALECLVRRHGARGAYEQGIQYGRRWVALDPLYEPAQRGLMRLYAWAGQWAAALRQYEECARLLEEELGVEPDGETRALYEAIRTRQLDPPASADVAEPPPPPARERYVQETLLSAGGHGQVYRGRDRFTDQPVVIKRLRAELMTQEPQWVARFAREGEALRQLNHPNIVRMLDVVEEGDQHSIVMEYVPGGSLRALLDQEPQLPLERALDIALELADALSRAHHLGIIHRDLKPENVLLAADGTPRLSDFGLARLKRAEVRLTQPGSVMGSPAYMSPEALQGQELDARSDVWSFGVLLYEMLAGRLPFEGENVPTVITNILTEPVPGIGRFRPDAPSPLADLLRRMLVKVRKGRIASMRQVAAELEALRAGREVVRVTARPEGETPTGKTPMPEREQEIHFCTSSDGVRIAYAVVGDGPVFVKAANWLSHLEFDWNSPVWRHWLDALSHDQTLVRYDERGCGLSDWEVEELSVDAFVRDLEAVVDTLGLERFPLMGISQGGPIAIAYAVRHPEKVSHLILYGTYGAGRQNRTYSEEELEKAKTILSMMELGWGKGNPAFRQFFTTLFMPEATEEQMHWFNELQRVSTSPEMAVRLERTFFKIDVRDLLDRVRAPTLILHARDDAIVPFEEGRQLAAKIPDARFVTLDSKNHILLDSEPAWERFLTEIYNFLGIDKPIPLPERPRRTPRRSRQVKSVAGRPSESATAVRPMDNGPSTSARDKAHPIPNNLPVQTTPLVGREDELAAIERLILGEPACRLLTLLGPGGIGKTRLAMQVAAQVAEGASVALDGVYFVSLPSVRSADGLVSVLADVLDCSLRGQEAPRVQLLDCLGDRRILLVLDNFEQLLGEGGARLVDDILEASGSIKLLVTSREVLSLQEEWLYPVQGLPYPEDDEQDPQAFDAVRLFVERARRVHRGFSPADEMPGIVRICRLVEGLPLAIELAAAWTKTLSCAAIAAEIERNLDFLATNLRDVPERHRSVQAVFGHSWERLKEAERDAFQRLAVFRGGFGREVAERVAGASLMILSTLVDKSLLRQRPDGRYYVHELLRQCAEEKLQTDPQQVVNLHSAHSAFYADLLYACLKDMQGGRQREAAQKIETELENVRAAWEWAVELAKIEEIEKSIQSLSMFFQYQSRYLEGARAFERAVQSLEEVSETEQTEWVLAAALVEQAWFYVRLGRLEEAKAAAERSHAIYHRLDVPPPPGFATDPLLAEGIIASTQGDYDLAAQAGERSLEVSQARDDPLNRELAHYLLARAALAQGRFETAQEHAQRAYAITQQTQDRWFMAYSLNELGNVACALRDYDAAKKHFQASFALRQEFDDPEGMALALTRLGEIALRQENDAEAERLGQQSLTIYQGINDRGGLASALNVLGNVAVAQGDDSTARARFRQALQIATAIHFVPLILALMTGVAELSFRAGQTERGLELLALAQSHPASDQQTKARARERLADYESELDPAQFDAITLRGQGQDLEAAIGELQRELEVADGAERSAHERLQKMEITA